MIPIYKDTFYTHSGTGLTYTISIADSSEIFSGIALAYPNTNSYSININRVCENYLHSNFTYSDTGKVSGIDLDAAKTFVLQDLSGNTLASYRFYNDWSYETLSGNTLSKPVNGRYAKGQHYFNTIINNGEDIITTDNIESADTEYCGEYALYYLNKFGGWDSFLIEGKVVEKDDFEISTYEKYRNNNNRLDRESVRYRNEITHSWELNTSWLTDNEAKILAKHLFSSNQVYLHNIVSGEIYPVDIQDKSVEYKKFLNERKLIQYTINVKESNKKLVC